MQTTIEMISKLVSFDTVSFKSNLKLIDAIQSDLESQGIVCNRVYNTDRTKANIYATIGPMVAGGVVLSGHTDVVPVENQSWTYDPFKLANENGKLYGRGATDMKSFVAIALSLVPDMLKADLKRPIHLAFSYDEEPGCLGAPSMIEDMVKNLPAIDAVIVGEPTNMKVASSHKGVYSAQTTFKGLEAHSSQTDKGVSAIHFAVRLMAELDEIADELKQNPVKDTTMVPPYSTLNMGIVNGGIASNIIARDCMFTWDYRYMPGEDPHVVLDRIDNKASLLQAQMREFYPDAAIEFEKATIPSLRPEASGAAEELCRQLTGENSTIEVPYGTEAGQFQERGYSTVVCGPGSIDQAHKPDEYIELGQVKLGIEFVQRLIERQSK